MQDPVEANRALASSSPKASIPLFYFATVPVAILAAGGLLLAQGGAVLQSNWAPQTLALTHIGTLGIVSMTWLGVAFPLAARFVGPGAPGGRLARAVYVLLAAGLTGLVTGLLTDESRVTFVSLASLALAMLVFLIPMGTAVFRAADGGPMLSGLRLALANLFGVAFLGLWMAHGYVDIPFPGARDLWVQVHLSVGILGWVGGLLAVVSWWALPLLHAARPVAVSRQRAILVFAAAGTALPVVILFADYFGVLPAAPQGWTRLATLAAAPAAYAIWFVQPMVVLEALRGGDRSAEGSSPGLWRAACIAAFATAAAAIAVEWLPDPRWNLLFGWLAIWGWAGLAVRAILTELVPALLRSGSLEPGSQRRASASVAVGLTLHVASLAVGALAIVTTSDLAARAAGLLVLAAGVELGVRLRAVIRSAADEAPAAG